MFVYSIMGVLVGIVLTIMAFKLKDLDVSAGKKAGIAILGFISVALIAFSFDWGYASVIEGEPRAMSIGFLVFGGLGILFGLGAYRLSVVKKTHAQKQEAAEITE